MNLHFKIVLENELGVEVGGSLSTHCSCADGDPAGGGGWQAYRGSGEAEGKRGGVGIRPFLSSSQETHRGQWHHFCGGLVHSVVVDSVTPWTLSMAQSPEGFSRPLCPWDFPARILECVAISFSRGSSRPRDRTCVFWLAGGSLPLSHPRAHWCHSGWMKS